MFFLLAWYLKGLMVTGLPNIAMISSSLLTLDKLALAQIVEYLLTFPSCSFAAHSKLPYRTFSTDLARELSDGSFSEPLSQISLVLSLQDVISNSLVNLMPGSPQVNAFHVLHTGDYRHTQGREDVQLRLPVCLKVFIEI